MPQLNSISLEQYLRRPNPAIKNIEVKGGKTDTKDKNPTTSSKNKNWDFPREVKRWESFRLDAFDLIYGEPLQQVLGLSGEFNDFSTIPEFPFCEICDEDSLESLLIRHVQSTVSEALAVAQSNLQNQSSGESIYMAKGGYALVSKSRGSKNPKDKPIYFYPDWAGVHRLDPPVKGPNLLPGDTKLARNWRSSHIKNIKIALTPWKGAWLWPLSQIFTYCLRSGVRYGYLITDKELVVVHIRSSDPDTLQPRRGSRHGDLPLQATIAEKGLLEWKAIPWTHDSGSDQLTVNLTLWWLHMMAARNGNLDEEDHANSSQCSNGQDTQGSATTFNGFDSQEPHTPNLADVPGTDNQGNDMSFLSNTSEVRQGLSRSTISDGDGEGNPTIPRPSRKRGRESEPKENARNIKRGGGRRN